MFFFSLVSISPQFRNFRIGFLIDEAVFSAANFWNSASISVFQSFHNILKSCDKNLAKVLNTCVYLWFYGFLIKPIAFFLKSFAPKWHSQGKSNYPPYHLFFFLMSRALMFSCFVKLFLSNQNPLQYYSNYKERRHYTFCSILCRNNALSWFYFSFLDNAHNCYKCSARLLAGVLFCNLFDFCAVLNRFLDFSFCLIPNLSAMFPCCRLSPSHRWSAFFLISLIIIDQTEVAVRFSSPKSYWIWQILSVFR